MLFLQRAFEMAYMLSTARLTEPNPFYWFNSEPRNRRLILSQVSRIGGWTSSRNTDIKGYK